MSSATSSRIPLPAGSSRSSLRSIALDECRALGTSNAGLGQVKDDDHDMLAVDLIEPDWTPSQGKSWEAMQTVFLPTLAENGDDTGLLAEQADVELTHENVETIDLDENEANPLSVENSAHEDGEASDEDNDDSGDSDVDDRLDLLEKRMQAVKSQMSELQHSVSRPSGSGPQTDWQTNYTAELADIWPKDRRPAPSSLEDTDVEVSQSDSDTDSPPSRLRQFIRKMNSAGTQGKQGISASGAQCLRQRICRKCQRDNDERRKGQKDRKESCQCPKYDYKKGERALLEIEIHQQTTDLLIPRKPFERLVREIAIEAGIVGDVRFTKDALRAIQVAAEKHLTGVLDNAYDLAIYAKRVTLKTEDIHLLRKLKGPDGEPLA